jgi:ABC-type multidrug transport system fused ATPase/permease subunit
MLKFSQLMKYATPRQKVLCAFGVFFLITAGCVAPLVSLVMGEAITIYDPRATDQEIHEGIIYLIKMISIISTTVWAFSYIQYAFMQHNAESLAFDLKERYLASLMRQETEFFER